MPTIIPIVEGDGDVDAVPLLLRRLLEVRQRWDWSIGRAKKAGGLSTLRRDIDRFLRYAQLEPDCGGVLILVDLDDGCPLAEVEELVRRAKLVQSSLPVAIVLAHREYEAWFLASAETLAGTYNLPASMNAPSHVEAIRGAKEWLTTQMPVGKAYKETLHQARLTNLIDLELAQSRSRSFRRLCHALDELIGPSPGAPQTNVVTPKL